MAVIAPMRGKQMIRLAFSVAILFGCIFTTVNTSDSQNTLNIAAVVNDDVISIYDLSQRVELVITFSNLQRNQ